MYVFIVSSTSPGVNPHFEEAPCMTGVTLSNVLCASHMSRSEGKGTPCELQSQALGTQDVTLLCTFPVRLLGLFQLCLFPPKPVSPKVHRMHSACAAKSNSIFSFIPVVELPALFLNLRVFQFLFHFRDVQVLGRYERFCLCLSHVWGGNNPGVLPLDLRCRVRD